VGVSLRAGNIIWRTREERESGEGGRGHAGRRTEPEEGDTKITPQPGSAAVAPSASWLHHPSTKLSYNPRTTRPTQRLPAARMCSACSRARILSASAARAALAASPRASSTSRASASRWASASLSKAARSCAHCRRHTRTSSHQTTTRFIFLTSLQRSPPHYPRPSSSLAPCFASSFYSSAARQSKAKSGQQQARIRKHTGAASLTLQTSPTTRTQHTDLPRDTVQLNLQRAESI
jgi:hypothetical protein